ncbi:MAG: BREX system P-loop protein BrxC [Bacteroidales bacterium]|nr:BREX system P-loop protein BrxC [Bacteroidales bacterium]
MQISKMFKRPIDREIKGVVKVGQDLDDNIHQELEEYVVTDELHKHIGEFFAAYRKGIETQTDEIGVWISGFFGSGKSHFLKILSYLVENRKVLDRYAIDYFEDKIHDPKILEDIRKVSEVKTDVILFDIDAKSETDSMANKDSIVKVLNKVFNEMQGFCGSIPWIAEIERSMQKDGRYDAFRETFKQISGNSWEDSREDFYYEEDAIIEALSKSTQMSEEASRNWFERAEQDYTISIERFVKRVKEYLDTKGSNHHIAFFIDEVGQYIGDNSHAMLNLQTIVHEFGRQCKGRAWIAVTSQEDIDSVLTVKGNDFSKIQGRFDTKLSLSSAYVDEVIKKRILVKNQAGQQTLGEVYRKNKSILQSILTFTEESAEMKQYQDEQDFIDVYPFIPYQFNLLQRVFAGVRIHGASGRHLAEGERSLLSAFQESAIRFSSENEGMLVPFYAFYETIETFLEHSIRGVIIHAEKNSKLNAFDVEVLKVLFLIKYVKELPANLDNIATLMIDHLDVDIIDLKKMIERSLIRLVGQTLIQKDGDQYTFLTNDEQDVNREIKHMQVESTEVIRKIGEEIFDGIYRDRKYRYSAKYNFDFNAFIDDRPVRTQSSDIGIRVLTPYADASLNYNEYELKMMSARENNVIVKLPADTSYLEEMEEILKIQAYLKLKSGTSASQVIEDIKLKKAREVTERRERVTTFVKEALKDAEIYVNSQILDIQKKNPVDRINDAFRMLIKALYHKLDLITPSIDSAKDLAELLNSSKQLTIDSESEENYLAIKEVDNYVTRLTNRNQNLSVKSITTYFSNLPYGWIELDTTAILLQLFKAQEVKFILNSSQLQLNDLNLINYLTKRDYVDRVIVRKRERISEVLLKNARDLIKDMFGISALPQDEDGLKEQFNTLLKNEQEQIIDLLANYRNQYYPGEDILSNGKTLILDILNISDTATYFKKLRELRHDLKTYAIEAKQIKGFFENQQPIYDKTRKCLTIFERNRTYITDPEMHQIVEQMESIVNQVEPYSQIQELPALNQSFDDQFIVILERECAPVRERIEEDLAEVMKEMESNHEWKKVFSGTFRARFQTLLDRLERVNSLYEAIAMEVESDRLKVRCMNELYQYEPELVPTDTNSGDDSGVQPLSKPVIKERKTKTLSKNKVIRGSRTFHSKQDIDQFVEELRNQLLAELDENTTINLV